MRAMRWRQLGDILVQDKGLSEEIIRQALREQENNQLKLGEIIREKGIASEAVLAEALATQSGMEYIAEPAVKSSALHLLTTVPIAYAKENLAVPLEIDGQTIRLAVADPNNNRILNDLSVLTGCRIIPCLASPDKLLQAINQAYEMLSGGGDSSMADIDAGELDLDEHVQMEDLLDTSDEAPIIRFVNGLVTQAYRRRASDIHIEPFETEVMIRYRVDGILYEVQRPPLRACRTSSRD